METRGGLAGADPLGGPVHDVDLEGFGLTGGVRVGFARAIQGEVHQVLVAHLEVRDVAVTGAAWGGEMPPGGDLVRIHAPFRIRGLFPIQREGPCRAEPP